ncbi:putative enzyme [Bacillus sp. 349Y]|nr:putative enzyme [Bacillus sp. 349Y]
MITFYFIIFMVFLPLLKKNRKEYYSHYSDSITALNQTVVGNPTILMQRSSFWFLDKILSKVRKTNGKQYNIGVLEGSASSLVTLTESMGSLAILWKGSQLVIQGTLSLGSLVAFQSMMTSFITPIQQLVLIQNEIQNLRILTQRLDDLYEVKVERATLPISKEESIQNYNIRLENVSFSYYYDQNILEKISFEVREGSKVGVIGNSGSGKTTMLKLIASIYSPTKGHLFLGNKPYENFSLSKLREDIAYVDQTPFVFEGTIIDNLIMGSPLREQNYDHINEIAYICDLYSLNSKIHNNLDMILDENGNNLSGGQKQKIGIARALIKNQRYYFWMKQQVILMKKVNKEYFRIYIH